MGIPGEDLPGSWAATELVGWYNGHPDYRDLEFDLSCKRAVVIGNGNVAMDVARMLVLPREELDTTDTADHAIEAFAACADRGGGDRGPPRARPRRPSPTPSCWSWASSAEADVVVDPADVELDEHSLLHIDAEGALTARKNVEILTGYSQREPTGKPKRVVLRFLRSPVKIHGDGRVESIELVRNELDHGSDGCPARQGHRRPRDARGGDRVPLDRLPRRADRGGALRRVEGHDPERGGARGRPSRAARDPRRVRGGLDQARPLGRDRHQQARRSGDGGQPGPGPSRGPAAGAGRGARRRRTWRACSPSARPTT